jgi:hypothetical protein
MFLGPPSDPLPCPFSVFISTGLSGLVEPLTTRLPQHERTFFNELSFALPSDFRAPCRCLFSSHYIDCTGPSHRPRGFSAAPLFTHKNSHAISVITRAPTLQSSRNAPCQINNEQNDSSSHCQRRPLWSGEITHCPPSQALFAECFFLAPAASTPSSVLRNVPCAALMVPFPDFFQCVCDRAVARQSTQTNETWRRVRIRRFRPQRARRPFACRTAPLSTRSRVRQRLQSNIAPT